MINNNKKVSGSKYVYLNYLKGDIFAWLTNNINYKVAAANDLMLINATPWRWKSVNLPWGTQVPWFELPTQMVDGLLAGEYVKEYYKSQYPDLKFFDVDVDEPDWRKKASYTKKILDTYDSILIFEPLFERDVSSHKFRIKGDILVKINGSIQLVEAKGVNTPKAYHALDVKYQKEFIRSCGYDVDNWKFSFAIMNKNYVSKGKPLEEIKELFSEWNSFFLSAPKDFGKALQEGKDISLKSFLDVDPKGNHLDFQLDKEQYKKVLQVIKPEWLKEFGNFDSLLNKMIDIQMPNEPPKEGIKPSFASMMDSDYQVYALKINGLVSNSIFNFVGDSGFSFKKKVDLWNSGIKLIKDVPTNDLLSKMYYSENPSLTDEQFIVDDPKKSRRLIQKKFLDNDEPLIFRTQINNWVVQNIEYSEPIIMYDFETASMAVPINKGASPYTQTPYQYSIHVITNPTDFDWKTKKNIEHFEFLAESRDFYVNFWNSFAAVMEKYPSATCVSYNMSFEKKIMNNALSFQREGLLSDETKKSIQSVIDRTVDLMDIFSNYYYYHKDFAGSYSIKKVSTHFAKDINYSDLDSRVQKGDQSAFQAKVWLHKLNDKFDNKGNIIQEMIFSPESTKSDEIWRSIRKPMLKYCEYDTLSMIAIYQEILKLI